MAEVGGDGFLSTNHRMSPIDISLLMDGLVPELQRRGFSRTACE